MSELRTIADIKIPYPTEGIIRTAQLDDTIAPENSVQLAVNMNFDRVGALQTRPGVTSYADVLVDGINAYGTLRNSVIPAGFDFIFQLGGTSELSPGEFNYPAAVKVSDTKITVFWSDASGVGYGQNFSIDEVVGSVSPIGTRVSFESGLSAKSEAILVDTDVVLNVWQQGTGGTTGAAYARAFNVAADTIVAGTAYNFDSAGFDFALGSVNSTHVVCFYGVTSGANFATVFAINLSTLVITEPGSDLNFDSGGATSNSCLPIGSNRFINTWSNSGSIKVRVFEVNTSTWAITTSAAVLTPGATSTLNNLLPIGDNQHFINIFKSGGVFLGAQVFEINLSTFVVTAVGTPLPSTIIATSDLSAARFDANHYAAFYSVGAGTGHVQMLNVSGSFVVTLIANNLTGYDFGTAGSSVALNLTSTEVMVVWGGFTSETGKAAMFKPYGTVVNGRWLYASSGTVIYNTSSTTWAPRRSGLAVVSKPRFAQYLNYIWMVNGNAQIGGNDVATSNGGAFGSDLVPANFPPGDFISAGFEGRVWVANKTLGVIYYTDIVQFIPPVTYILTYNPDVNFISQIAPQSGQTMTALYRVPRALLVFTEDTITRIYGATSIDAYPAYNVGTFSQESIIETKTGIFFHHSSGFYQFDYGAQPVEISRRIIDFVKAIPRSAYANITGVYDGFDCVEWSVGQVTVEGVVFGNCVLRYTISTQVWTVYDYVANNIKAMIFYDDGTTLNHLMGTLAGKTGAMDTGNTDFGEPFYFEFIDRWRSYTEMYYKQKSASGFSIYSENAAGANLSYQIQKSGPNAWNPIGTVTAENNSLLPNSSTDDFDVMRIRLAGNTKGAQVVVHGIEITSITIKGQDQN